MRQRGPFDTDGLAVEVEDWLPELGAAAIEARIRKNGLDFTAIVAAGDSLAVGAAIGLERLGKRVPDDVSIVGIDDLPQAAFATPPLTTMHMPMREIGAPTSTCCSTISAAPPCRRAGSRSPAT